jgi:hypothetical protein
MEALIKGGTRPLRRQPRRHAHHVFGSTSPYSIPNFNLDMGWHPDQMADNAPTECTGYTVAKILTDLTGIMRDPDWHYAAARFIEGAPPGVDGADFHAAMNGAVGVGSLPATAAILTAKHNGELTVSDWTNWDANQKALALKYVQNGTLNALGNGEPFDSILSASYTGKIGICIGSPWFPEWSAAGIGNSFTRNPDGSMSFGAGVTKTGIMPKPLITQLGSLGWHAYVVLGKDSTYKSEYAIAYPHQGDGFGEKGIVYFDRDTINAVLAIPGTGAITFNPYADHWASLIGIVLGRFPLAVPFAPQLLQVWKH